MNNRSRLEPPLSPNYFGNSFQTETVMTTAGELHEHGLGWAAWKLNQVVVNHTDKSIRGFVNDWLRSPFVYQCLTHLYARSVLIGSSPRFNTYGNEFGLGKALTV
ncbi:hypothetical protein GOBAR_AA08863 [Gossypium barbadense]|nr:hypothetical protein GOBAR_AA08863 [Gossypium barbadense]